MPLKWLFKSRVICYNVRLPSESEPYMADMTPQQIKELLEVLQRISNALVGIDSTLKHANLHSYLSQIAQRLGR